MKLNVIYNNEKKFEAEHRSMKEAIKFTKKVLRENRMVGKFYILSSVDGKQVCSISYYKNHNNRLAFRVFGYYCGFEHDYE